MQNSTRKLFNAYCAQLATLNGVGSATEAFAVEPTVEQKLEDRIQENADFLGEVNFIPVNEMSGEILGLGIDTPVASRTDTTTKDRQPKSVGGLVPRSYQCVKTEFDTYVGYNRLDSWAKFPDFQPRLRNHTMMQIARDRLTIGWNGVSAAADTDLAANPLLQDVNIGWLQHIRNDAPERVLTNVKIGAGGDFNNLDAAVFDAANELLDPWHRHDTDIVAITGYGLVSDKYLGLINANDAPTEKAALNTLMSNKTLGNRRSKVVPFFPSKSILLTKASNLSIYWQSGSHRRKVEDNAKRDRIEDYNSINEAYVIEDMGACAFIDSILTPDGAGGWN